MKRMPVIAALLVGLVSTLALGAPQPASAPRSAEVVLQTGASTRRFVLGRKLGYGAWSDTYEAREAGTGNALVAIKVLRSDQLARGAKDSYDKELLVTTQARAKSKAIGKDTSLMDIYGIGHTSDGQRALVMEYVAGGKIEPKARPSFEAAQIGLELLRGVRSLHLAGYRHNDLHVGNIAMDPAKGPRLLRVLDVGNAVPIESTSSPGQGGYGAPERQGVGVATELYAVGALLYYARTGLRPDRSGPDLSKVPEPALRQVIAKATDADPAKRFADAQAFVNALRPLTQRSNEATPRR